MTAEKEYEYELKRIEWEKKMGLKY